MVEQDRFIVGDSESLSLLGLESMKIEEVKSESLEDVKSLSTIALTPAEVSIIVRENANIEDSFAKEFLCYLKNIDDNSLNKLDALEKYKDIRANVLRELLENIE